MSPLSGMFATAFVLAAATIATDLWVRWKSWR